MPMSAYVGLTGSGKSYNAVKHVIIPALKNKRIVYTNIPMKNDLCFEDFGHSVVQFNTQDLLDNPNWFTEVFQSGAILVFDEVWRLWPAGMTASKISQQHKTFLAEHRHLVGDDGFCTEIILCTQDLAQLAPFSTMLVDFTYISNSLEDMGMKNRIRVDVYKGAVKGLKVNNKARQREFQDKIEWEKGDAGYYYVSQTKSNSDTIGVESRSDRRFNVFGGFKTKLIIFLFLALSVGLVTGVKSFFTDNALVGTSVPKPETTNVNTAKSLPANNNSQMTGSTIKPTNPAPVLPLKPAVNDLDIVSLTSNIYIIGFINDVYYFKLDDADSLAVLNSSDLIKLGYTVDVINPCLVKIVGFKNTHFSMCQDNGNSNDFIRNPVS